MSAAGGAFAVLATGSVALTSVQLFAVASFRQPVTLTMSTFCETGAVCSSRSATTISMARMIAKVNLAWRTWLAAGTAVLAMAAPLRAHDLERTQVLLSFARDGSFVLDVANDPGWLKLRLEPFRGSFADRIVLWV